MKINNLVLLMMLGSIMPTTDQYWCRVVSFGNSKLPSKQIHGDVAASVHGK